MTKPFVIPKQLVWDAFQRVKANGGSAGVDKESIEQFESKLKDNLYKHWNRMASGSYFPRRSKPYRSRRKAGEQGSWACRQLQIEWHRQWSRWFSSQSLSQSSIETHTVTGRGVPLWTR